MTQTIPKIIANFETSLVNALTTGSTFNLVSNLDSDGNTLADGLYGFTINEGQSNEEHLFGTLVGSTVTITIRNIKRNDSVTAQTGLSHRKGDSIKITNFPALMRIQRILLGITGIDSANPLFYDTDFIPTSAAELATKQYVDNTATGSAIYDQSKLGSICGENVVEGEYVYLKEADGKWWKTDASDSATSENVVVGVAQGTGTADGAIAGGVLVGGLDKTQTYTAGAKYYLQDTAGDVGTSKGTIEVFVGTGDANNNLVFQHLSNIETLTADEKDALVGNSGITPDANNKFIDNADTTIAAVQTATTISFADSDPDTILDSGSGFITAGFKVGDSITVSGSTSNDGTYTIAGISAGTITLISGDTLTAEVAGDTVTITATIASKLVRLKSDGKLPILDGSNLTNISKANSLVNPYTAGETIDASTTPKAVYLKASDGKVWLTDTDADESTFKFVGFVGQGQSVIADDSVNVTSEGVLSGFTGLTAGDRQYLSATAGVLGTTPVTNQDVEVGVAISTTEIFILQQGEKIVSGTSVFAGTAGDLTNIETIGFRLRYLIALTTITGSATTFYCNGIYHAGIGNYSICDRGNVNIFVAYLAQDDNSADAKVRIQVQNVTATSFDLFYDKYSGASSHNGGTVKYIAIG